MKKLTALTATFLVLMLALGAPARAGQTSGGAESFDFLNLDASARAVGMGGAYTALAADSNALLYNPGGLGQVNRSEATFMHNQYLQNVTQEYLSYADKRGFGASLNYLNFGSVTRTTYANPDGLNDTTGLNDLAVSGGYGRSFGPLAVGGSLKVLREQIDNVTGTGIAFDAGALYTVSQIKGLSFGGSLQNFGPDVKFQQTKEKLPMQLRAGAGYTVPAWGAVHTLAFDLTKQRTDKVRLGLGLESVVGRMMAMRFGFTTRNDAGIGITGGVGWIWNDLSIDYAIVPFDTLGIAHRISLTFRFGGQSAKSAASLQPAGQLVYSK